MKIQFVNLWGQLELFHSWVVFVYVLSFYMFPAGSCFHYHKFNDIIIIILIIFSIGL